MKISPLTYAEVLQVSIQRVTKSRYAKVRRVKAIATLVSAWRYLDTPGKNRCSFCTIACGHQLTCDVCRERFGKLLRRSGLGV